MVRTQIEPSPGHPSLGTTSGAVAARMQAVLSHVTRKAPSLETRAPRFSSSTGWSHIAHRKSPARRRSRIPRLLSSVSKSESHTALTVARFRIGDLQVPVSRTEYYCRPCRVSTCRVVHFSASIAENGGERRRRLGIRPDVGVRRYATASAARDAAPRAGDSSPRATSTMRTSRQCWGKAALAAASRIGPR